jgi:DNA-binding transcriptional LysR family regulator
MLELRHFRYFVAVAEELHFGRAAQRLHISQPPLSQQIQAMEDILSVKLFRRSRRKVELTEAGAILLCEARKALTQADHAVSVVRGAARGEVGSLVIGFTGSSPFNDVMPRLIGRFRHAWPDVQLSLREMSTAAQMAALTEGGLDLGFARPGTGLPFAEVELRLVQREPLLAVFDSRHPLAARSRVAMADLADQPFIMHPRHIGVGLYDRVMDVASAAGFRPRVVIEAHQMSTVVSLAAIGVGVSVVPEGMRRVSIDGLEFRPLTDAMAHVDLFVACRRDHRPTTVTNFLSLVAPGEPGL